MEKGVGSVEESEALKTVRRILSEVLEIDEAQIRRDSTLVDDLGIESVDLLNIGLRIENEFNFRIEEGELWNVGLDFVDNDRYIKGEILTKDGIAEISQRFPLIEFSEIGDQDISFYDIVALITVEMIVDYVLRKLQKEKNA